MCFSFHFVTLLCIVIQHSPMDQCVTVHLFGLYMYMPLQTFVPFSIQWTRWMSISIKSTHTHTHTSCTFCANMNLGYCDFSSHLLVEITLCVSNHVQNVIRCFPFTKQHILQYAFLIQWNCCIISGSFYVVCLIFGHQWGILEVKFLNGQNDFSISAAENLVKSKRFNKIRSVQIHINLSMTDSLGEHFCPLLSKFSPCAISTAGKDAKGTKRCSTIARISTKSGFRDWQFFYCNTWTELHW